MGTGGDESARHLGHQFKGIGAGVLDAVDPRTGESVGHHPVGEVAHSDEGGSGRPLCDGPRQAYLCVGVGRCRVEPADTADIASAVLVLRSVEIATAEAECDDVVRIHEGRPRIGSVHGQPISNLAIVAACGVEGGIYIAPIGL